MTTNPGLADPNTLNLMFYPDMYVDCTTAHTVRAVVASGPMDDESRAMSRVRFYIGQIVEYLATDPEPVNGWYTDLPTPPSDLNDQNSEAWWYFTHLMAAQNWKVRMPGDQINVCPDRYPLDEAVRHQIDGYLRDISACLRQIDDLPNREWYSDFPEPPPILITDLRSAPWRYFTNMLSAINWVVKYRDGKLHLKIRREVRRFI